MKTLNIPNEDVVEFQKILSGWYSSNLDALGHCAGAGHYPDYKRTSPNFKQIEILKNNMAKIENYAAQLNVKLLWSSRKKDVFDYLQEQIGIWLSLDISPEGR